jgi:hypothetical protein
MTPTYIHKWGITTYDFENLFFEKIWYFHKSYSYTYKKSPSFILTIFMTKYLKGHFTLLLLVEKTKDSSIWLVEIKSFFVGPSH